jgi:peptidoglycan/LPS O-acetylase OafA/YrhL
MATRLPQLDGIRGFAAVAVVVAHFFGEPASGLEQLQFGWLGVEVFFVLSGFLIGGIILDELGRPGFWRSFYVRRTARILPPYVAAVAFVLSLGATVSPWAYLTFTHNFVFAARGMDAYYTHPLWTLAVEEQFYLLLPLLVAITPRRALLPALIALFCAAPLFRLLVTPVNPTAASVLLFGRMDMLLAGVIGAWGLRNLDLRPHLLLLRLAPMPLLFAASAIHFLISFADFTIWGQGLIAMGVASFLVALALGAPEFRGVLSHRVSVFFGTISYSLYLVHQPLNTLLHRRLLGAEPDVGSPAQIGVTLAAMGGSVLLAWASWELVERHLLVAARRWLAAREGR